MGFFGNWLGTKPATAPPLTTMSPTGRHRGISYDPALIKSLLADHAQLGAIFQRIGELRAAGSYQEMRGLLVNFKSRLEAHLLTENVRFYGYLEQTLGDDPANAEIIHDFRHEMNSIARGVIDFVKKYQSSAFTEAERTQFLADYTAVGKILEQRLDSEENQLYPLYQPS